MKQLGVIVSHKAYDLIQVLPEVIGFHFHQLQSQDCSMAISLKKKYGFPKVFAEKSI